MKNKPNKNWVEIKETSPLPRPVNFKDRQAGDIFVIITNERFVFGHYIKGEDGNNDFWWWPYDWQPAEEVTHYMPISPLPSLKNAVLN